MPHKVDPMLPKDNFVGIGLRPPHFKEILEKKPSSVGWLEVHAENFFVKGGPSLHYLNKIRENYPISLHGVALSLGSPTIDESHLRKLKNLTEAIQPFLVSEHVSFSRVGDVFLNDLVALPYTEESLKIICQNIDHVQNVLKRQILVENPSQYMRYKHSTIPEHDFLNEMVERTGCGLLLDINNAYISAKNFGLSTEEYLEKIKHDHVKEIHLAGHAVKKLDDKKTIRIDDHGSEVCDDVWALFENYIKPCATPPPVLIEWDTDIPNLDTLLEQATIAKQKSIQKQ